MRGQHLDLAERRDAELHARAAHLRAADALLDDAAVPPSCPRYARSVDVGLLEGHRLDAAAQLGALVGGAGRRQVAQVDGRVPAAGDAVVELHDRARHRPAARACPRAPRRPRRGRAGPRGPGVDDAGVREQPPAPRLRAERKVSRDRRRRAGCRASARRRARACSSSTARDGRAAGSGISERTCASTRGRSSSFSASDRARAVVRRDHVQAAPRLARDDARQQPEVVLDDRSRAPAARSGRSRAGAAGAAGTAGTGTAPRAPAPSRRPASRRA